MTNMLVSIPRTNNSRRVWYGTVPCDMSSEDPRTTPRFAGSHYKSHDGPVHGRRVPRTCHRGPRSKPCSRRRGRRGALCQGPLATAAGGRGIRPSRRGCTTVPTRRVCDENPCSRARFPDRRPPVRAPSHPGRGRPLTCTSLAAQRGPSCDLYRFVQNRGVVRGSSLGMPAPETSVSAAPRARGRCDRPNRGGRPAAGVKLAWAEAACAPAYMYSGILCEVCWGITLPHPFPFSWFRRGF